MFASALVLIAHLAFVPPEVRGEGTCPSVAEVRERLGPLLPAAAGEGAADIVVLEASGEKAVVRLRDPEGHVAHERALDTGASCADRATEAAVLVAAWEADLHADVAFPVAEPSAPTPPPPAAPSAPAPTAIVGTARVAAPPERAARPIEATVGAEIFVAAPPDMGATPAGAIEATWGRGTRWHGRAAISATGTHSLAFPPGAVSWRRGAVALGAVFDATTGRARLAVRADALAAAIFSQGSGFDVNAGATSWQAGADVGLRLSVPLTRRLSVWADVVSAWFPGTQRLSALNVKGTPELPSVEIEGGLGVSLSFIP